MPNYKNGKIYKLVCTLPNVDDIYVGGTTTTLNKRLSGHKGDARASKDAKVYAFMREHGIENFKIELLETCPCDTRKELNLREQHWCDTLHPSLNTQSASRVPNADKIYNDKPENKARCKAWRITNREKRSKQNRALYLAWTPEHRALVNAKTREKRANEDPVKREERRCKQRERQANWSDEYKELRKARDRERHAKKKLLLSKNE